MQRKDAWRTISSVFCDGLYRMDYFGAKAGVYVDAFMENLSGTADETVFAKVEG